MPIYWILVTTIVVAYIIYYGVVIAQDVLKQSKAKNGQETEDIAPPTGGPIKAKKVDVADNGQVLIDKDKNKEDSPEKSEPDKDNQREDSKEDSNSDVEEVPEEVIPKDAEKAPKEAKGNSWGPRPKGEGKKEDVKDSEGQKEAAKPAAPAQTQKPETKPSEPKLTPEALDLMNRQTYSQMAEVPKKVEKVLTPDQFFEVIRSQIYQGPNEAKLIVIEKLEAA